MVLLELIERWIERTKGMAEEAMIGVGLRGGRSGADVVRAFVVRDRNRVTRDIRGVFVRQRKAAGTKAGEQQKRDTGALDPRRTAEHQNQLNDTRCGASRSGRLLPHRLLPPQLTRRPQQLLQECKCWRAKFSASS
jgi:hypothetical protein